MANTRGDEGARQRDASAGRAGGGGNRGFYLLLGAVAVAGIAALIFAMGGGDGAPETLPPSAADMDAEASAAAGVSMGPDDAPVTIIEFEDFQCPACRNFNATTGRLLRNEFARGDDAILRWVSYDYPVLGQGSWPPAVAARCAETQGRFWQMHDLLYARTESWRGESNPNGVFIGLAEELGLDTDRYRECLADRAHLQDVASSLNYGQSLGVSGTPTLYLNGRRLNVQREGGYQALRERILEAAEAAETTDETDAADSGEE
ncbi:MAG: DsbA family protein [Gemmatimonadota bacterium]